MANLKLDDAGRPARRIRGQGGGGQIAAPLAAGAVQIHGGIGMTDELNVGHYFKRLVLLETLYGSPDHHLRRMAVLDQ